MAKAKEQKQTIVPVELTGMVDVIGTDETKYMQTGKVYNVTANVAQKLILKGAKLV